MKLISWFDSKYQYFSIALEYTGARSLNSIVFVKKIYRVGIFKISNYNVYHTGDSFFKELDLNKLKINQKIATIRIILK